MNVDETKSNDLLINDVHYKTGRDIIRVPYEVLFGIRTLSPEDKEICGWLEMEKRIKIKYIYRGRGISVEHGYYLEGVYLYITKDSVIPNKIVHIKRELYEKFKFDGIDSKEHLEWGITPEKAIFFVRLEDELKSQVDSFIYDNLKTKVNKLGAVLEFTCFDLAKRLNEAYEYRVCYPDENELMKHDGDGSNRKIKQELKRLIMKNNYAGIYDNIFPNIRFIIKMK